MRIAWISMKMGVSSMKNPWAFLSRAKPYRFILSVSIHMLIFSIPISMVITPKIHEMELFISIEDIQVPPEPLKMRMATKKPQSKPVKEMIKPIEPSYPKIQNPETIEPVKEAMKEPMKETKEESIKVESMSQSITESKEALFISPVSSITERNSPISAEGRAIETVSDVEKQPLVSHHVAGGDTDIPIETRFGASIAPAFLHREMPVYPMMARKLGREGKVVLMLTIDENGNLLNAEVMDKAGYGFTEAAVEAVKKSTFLPAKKDGKPIASRALLPIRFRLERN
jgi:protein TonB